MAMSIGRIGLAAASGGDGFTMLDPFEWQQSGRGVDLYGIQAGMTETALLWWRDQMLGFATDGAGQELEVPVTTSLVTALNGYYRVTDVAVSHPQGTLNGGLLHAPWSLRLERVTDWRTPRTELVGAWGQISNGYGVTGNLVQAAPPSITDWAPAVPSGSATYTTRSCGDGGTSVNIAHNSSPGTSGTYYARYMGALANHYQGGARVEYDYLGTSTFAAVVGRRTFNDSTETAKVRLSNGLTRVTLSSTAILVSNWNGSSWGTNISFALYSLTSSLTLSYQRVAVVTNTPENVVVRAYCTLSGGAMSDGIFQVDFLLRRGHRAVFIRVQRAAQWRLRFTSTTACTALTGGLRATSNDANGNRMVITGSDASTFDTTNGYVSQTGSGPKLVAAITCEVTGSSATGQNGAQNQLAECYATVAEVQRQVAY